MKHRLIALLVTTSFVFTACAQMSDGQRTTASGAGIGAAAGAALGAVTAGGHTGRSAATGAAVGAGLGALGGYIWSQRMEEQKQKMQQATAGTGVTVTQAPDNSLKLNIPSDISFDVGRADIKSNFRPILDQFAQSLNAHQVTTVRIIGHTDSTGNDAINDPLSVARANSVREYLGARGVNYNRVGTEGHGSREPIANNNTDAGRAQNRRVEIFVAEQQVSQAAPR